MSLCPWKAILSWIDSISEGEGRGAAGESNAGEFGKGRSNPEARKHRGGKLRGSWTSNTRSKHRTGLRIRRRNNIRQEEGSRTLRRKTEKGQGLEE